MAEGYGDFYRGFIERQGAASSTDASDHDLIAAPGTGYQICISKISISNTSATDVEVQLKSNTTVFWTFFAPKGGGNEPSFPHPIHCASGEKLAFAASSGVTTVTVSAAGFQRKTPL